MSKDSNEIEKDNKLELAFIAIIGKYFESNNDYINVMKVNKKYRELAEYYHFNPISDLDLFPRIETQHFYMEQDFNNVLRSKFLYVNWTDKYITEDTVIYDDGSVLFNDNEMNAIDIDKLPYMGFKEKNKRTDDKRNYINKKSRFTVEIAEKYDKFIEDDTLRITKEFSCFDPITRDKDIYKELCEIIIEGNVNFINPYSIVNLEFLQILKLPNTRLKLFKKAIYNCPELSCVHLPVNLECENKCFYLTNITDIIIKSEIESSDFYNYVTSLFKVINRKSVCERSIEEDRVCSVRVHLINIPMNYVLFTFVIKDYIERNSIVTRGSNLIRIYINGIYVSFIFE